MTGTEELPEQTARGLLGLMFDEGGFEVPPDDLAPAALAGYRRHRRRKAALAGAATTVLVALIAGAALATGGREAHSGVEPGVWSTSAPSRPVVPAVPIGDCFGERETPVSADVEAAACQRLKQHLQTVFPDAIISTDRAVSLAKVMGSFTTRIAMQNAAAKDLYGVPQPRVIQDWTDAEQEQEAKGSEMVSAFSIDTPEAAHSFGVVSSYIDHSFGSAHQPCTGLTGCESVELSDGTTAEVSESSDSGTFTVSFRDSAGDAYRIAFNQAGPERYVDIPCATISEDCYADLSDGSIRPGTAPRHQVEIVKIAITRAQLIGIVKRPAFADLVQAYIANSSGR